MKGRGEIVNFPDGYFIIRNAASGKVLDVKDGSTADGAPVILADKKPASNDSQLWKYEDGFIVNKKSGLCLEITGAVGGSFVKPGSAIAQSARREQPASINQLWAYNYEYLTPYDPSVCISGKNDSLEPGTELVADKQVDFPNNPRQQWKFDEG
jgi:Ricin-type beta-trefoil lectin domain-like